MIIYLLLVNFLNYEYYTLWYYTSNFEGLWIELLRPKEKTKKKPDPEDVPNNVVWLGSIFDTPFSRSSGQTEIN